MSEKYVTNCVLNQATDKPNP